MQEQLKLFVGGLSYDSTNETLQEHFEQAGEVKYTKIITDRETGDSRGFGFVEMSNEDEVANAIEQLDGSTLDGRKIFVSKAKPRQ